MVAGGPPQAPPKGALGPDGRSAPVRHSYRRDNAVLRFPDDRPLIVFDGVCVLCSGFVRFVIDRDRVAAFRFAHAQSDLGGALFRHYGLDAKDFETNLLIEDGYAWGRLEAFIRIVARFGFPWTLASALLILPGPVRNWCYERIARNRYALFGRRDVCMVPSGLSPDRFIA